MIERRGFLFGLGAASGGLLMHTPAVEAAIGPEQVAKFIDVDRLSVYTRISGPVMKFDRESNLSPMLTDGLRLTLLDNKPLGIVERATITTESGGADITIVISHFPQKLINLCLKAHHIPFQWSINGVLVSGEMIPSTFEHGVL